MLTFLEQHWVAALIERDGLANSHHLSLKPKFSFHTSFGLLCWRFLCSLGNFENYLPLFFRNLSPSAQSERKVSGTGVCGIESAFTKPSIEPCQKVKIFQINSKSYRRGWIFRRAFDAILYESGCRPRKKILWQHTYRWNYYSLRQSHEVTEKG